MSMAMQAFSWRSDRAGNPRARGARRLARLVALALHALASSKVQAIDPGLPIPGTRSVYVFDVPFLHFGPMDVSSPIPGKLTFDFELGYGNTFSHTWHPQAIHNEFGRNSLPFSRNEAEILHGRHPEDFIAFVDVDVTRVALRAILGLTEHLSAALEVPYVSFAGLRLDSTVESFHRVFGLYDGERASFPRSQYPAFSWARSRASEKAAVSGCVPRPVS